MKKGKIADTGGEVKMDDEEQSRRFVETAKNLESGKNGTAFNNAMDRIGLDKGPSRDE